MAFSSPQTKSSVDDEEVQTLTIKQSNRGFFLLFKFFKFERIATGKVLACQIHNYH